VSFVPGPPSQGQSSLVATPARFSTDDEPGTTVTATIRDAFGNPLQARLVDLGASATDNIWSISPPSGQTDVNGRFVVTLTARSVGTQTLSAMCESLSLTTGITVDPGEPALASLEAQPTQLRADGVQTTLATFRIRDLADNPVPGYPVTLEVDGQGTWVDPAQGPTDAQGTFSARLKSTEPGQRIITGRAGSVSWSAIVNFTP
jgi:hypothetical protein